MAGRREQGLGIVCAKMVLGQLQLGDIVAFEGVDQALDRNRVQPLVVQNQGAHKTASRIFSSLDKGIDPMGRCIAILVGPHILVGIDVVDGYLDVIVAPIVEQIADPSPARQARRVVKKVAQFGEIGIQHVVSG